MTCQCLLIFRSKFFCSQSSDEEDEEDEQLAGKAVTRSPADVSATLLDHAFDENQEDTRPPLQLPPDDSDDIIALEALNKAIQGAIDNHSHLTNRISAQKTNLLKEQMKHILDMAHQRCQHRISQAVSQSKSTCNSTVALLRSKVEEMTQFFEFMKNNVTAMKNTCGALQKQAESIMASSKSELEKQEAEEMKKLQSVHDSVQSAFASGLKEIFAYKQKMRPDICIPLES
jgi:septal ring factor EnvC (AmiA/AmiB activator)